MKSFNSRGNEVERTWREDPEREGGRVGRGRVGRVGVVWMRSKGRIGMVLEQAGHCIVAWLDMMILLSAILEE